MRLVCATSVSLVELAEQGSYDLKLYQILNGLCIQIPPLKEHREDIPDLVNQILTRYIESNEISLRQFSTAALNFYVIITGPEILPNSPAQYTL